MTSVESCTLNVCSLGETFDIDMHICLVYFKTTDLCTCDDTSARVRALMLTCTGQHPVSLGAPDSSRIPLVICEALPLRKSANLDSASVVQSRTVGGAILQIATDEAKFTRRRKFGEIATEVLNRPELQLTRWSAEQAA